MFFEAPKLAKRVAAGKPSARQGKSASFGELMLQPKQPVAAGFTTKNGKKTQVKSGYRGVRQRPWGACGPAASRGVGMRGAPRGSPRARARGGHPYRGAHARSARPGKFAAEIRDPQHSARLWLVRRVLRNTRMHRDALTSSFFFLLAACLFSWSGMRAADGAASAHHQGTYDTAEEAARVYDAAARHMRGSAAVCNFPGGAHLLQLGTLARVQACDAHARMRRDGERLPGLPAHASAGAHQQPRGRAAVAAQVGPQAPARRAVTGACQWGVSRARGAAVWRAACGSDTARAANCFLPHLPCLSIQAVPRKPVKLAVSTPRIYAPPAPGAVRKSARVASAFSAAAAAVNASDGDEAAVAAARSDADAERCLADAADASAWLLSSSALF